MAQRLVLFGYVKIAGLCESFVCDGMRQDSAPRNSPVAFAGVAVPACFPWLHSQLYQVPHSRFRLLPLLPDIHPYSTAKPSVPIFHQAFHTGNSVVSKPSGHVHLYVVHDYSDISALTPGSEFS